MAIPRSTLITGALALFSTSALVYVLLKPPTPPPVNPLKSPVAKDEDAPPYTLAQPGALNPIAAKVLAEGGPRTPSTTASAGGLRRGVVRFRLAMDGTENLGPCLQQAWAKAALLSGESSGEVLTCQGSGSRSLDAQLVLAVAPLGTFGALKEAPKNGSCTARLTGTLTGGEGSSVRCRSCWIRRWGRWKVSARARRPTRSWH